MKGVDQATGKKILQSLRTYQQSLKSTFKENLFEIEVTL
jgi:hypothetical protein